MKTSISSFIAAVGLFVCHPVSGGTVTLSSAGGSQFANKSGNTLESGALVRVGTFDLPSATREATLSTTKDYHQLKAWFRPLGEGLVGRGSVLQAGTTGTSSGLRINDLPGDGGVFGTIQSINETQLPVGTQLFVWVFNQSTPEASDQWGIFTADTWTAPPSLGNNTLSTASTVRALHGTSALNQLQLKAIPPTFANWAWKTWPNHANPEQTSHSADNDGDHIPNLAEYAWGLNAAGRDTPRSSVNPSSVPGQGASFSFDVPKQRPDVVVSVERSVDLQTWVPAASVVTSSNAEFDTHTCTAAAGTKCFWRVIFTSAANN
ncbi:MAG: hypothetical protein JNJ83_14600 [Verrucomicrobiaceae bacterium]|nr:hypothetical protein [Verrucomicrobiaceae bacterium]